MQYHDKPIAIVGVGGEFPSSPTLDQFWDHITTNTNTSRNPPENRWLLGAESVYHPVKGMVDHVYSQKACFIDDAQDTLPIAGLDIEDEFLSKLDPMFRLLLRVGKQAWDDATHQSVDRMRAGIIIGNLALPSEKSSALARELLGRTLEEKVLGKLANQGDIQLDPLNAHVAGLPAAILAKALGLRGSCFTLDAACASSLYAIKLAMDELRAGRADVMLAGGLSRPDSLYTQMGFSQLHALSARGVSAPFDRLGDGLVVGEGCGMFVLKRVDDAVADGDHIYGVIRAVGLANDIGGGLLVPESEGQLRAMRDAYRQAGWSPSDVDMIECHATGTPVGDVVEFASMQTLWAEESWQPGQCVIGSVKSNVGHLLTAAGSAALIKTLFAIKSAQLPPTANFSEPAKGISLDGSPFKILQEMQPWLPRAEGEPRRAAVSSFGFGGINAHMLLEEWIPTSSREPTVALHPSSQHQQAVAIVGMGIHYGPWDSVESFASRVVDGDNKEQAKAVQHWWGVEQSRWFERAGLKADNFKGYLIEEVTADLGAFRIPPHEQAEMLPRQMLMLNVAKQALLDAGMEDDDQLFTGVFIGTGLDLNATNFTVRWSLAEAAPRWAKTLGLDLTDEELAAWTLALRDSAGPALTAGRTMGALGSIVASRVAKAFRMGGPSFTLSSEDNSGLRALEVGVRALQRGEINRALVGAVDMAGDLRSVFSEYARQLKAGSDAPLIGEGAAALMLKRLEDAKQDGDHIYAVIHGVGTAIGGEAEQSTLSSMVCRQSLQGACDEAQLDADSIGYVEIDGMLSNADAEADALASFFAKRKEAVAIGQSMQQIGHAGATSGLASLMKAVLCLHQSKLPEWVGSQSSSNSPWQQYSNLFSMGDSPRYWLHNKSDGPRRAVVAGAGMDGSCSHVLLESCPVSVKQTSLPTVPTLKEGLFVVQAENVEGLLQQLHALQQMVVANASIAAHELARLWYQRHRAATERSFILTLVADDGAMLLLQLHEASQSLLNNAEQSIGCHGSINLPPQRFNHLHDRIFYNPEPLTKLGKVAFVFPGSGNHFAGMGRDLSTCWPQIFAAQEERSEQLASQYLPQHVWQQELNESFYDDHNALVISHVALGTAVSDIIRSFGIEPAAVTGYSLGESTSLFSLGAWQDRDAMVQRLQSSTLFTSDLAGSCDAAAQMWQLSHGESVDWLLGIVDVSADIVRQVLPQFPRAYLLIVNTYSECVVGGDRTQVLALVHTLQSHFFPLKGVTTVHCGVVTPVAEAYRALHLFETNPPEGIDFYGFASGEKYTPSRETSADGILAQAMHSVDYTKVIEQAYQDGVRLFFEIGPGQSCRRMIASILGDRPHLARSACYAGESASGLILRLLAHAIAEHVPVNLDVLYAPLESSTEPAKRKQQATTIGGEAYSSVPYPASRVKKPSEPQLPFVVKQEPSIAQENIRMERQPVVSQYSVQATTSSAEQVKTEPWVNSLAATMAAKADAHARYLSFSQEMQTAMGNNIQLQLDLLQQQPSTEVVVEEGVLKGPEPLPQGPASVLSREQCMEFAIGKIGNVLGAEFSEIDKHPTRVRLPDEPLMLVDRILSIEGEPRSMTSGRVVTEHDVTADRWYLDGGHIPTCVAVEAGQADLFLSGYLGIDFITKGKAMYRLLDAVVTFHDSLPKVGDVIHYDIHIDSFFRQDQTYLFRFHFESTVNGQPLMSMNDGCAGFFTHTELDAGQGIIHTKFDLMPKLGVLPEGWRSPLPMAVESWDDQQIISLYAGDLAVCFGPRFASLPFAPYTLPPQSHLKLVDRVIDVQPDGGRYGIGQIRAEMDISPDDWFITCHFVDDQVMPGTLMYECCMHTLRIYLLRMGWVGAAGATWCEPIPGIDSGLKCRGQVIETTKVVTYQVDIKELGYGPEPYAIVNALMFADGKPIVEISNMSARFCGLDQSSVEALWQDQSMPLPQKQMRKILYDTDRITAYAIGKPSYAFGDQYKIFDEQRKIARLPGPPFQFLDRIMAVTGEPWVMQAGATVEAEYDVPPDAWYFTEGRQAEMPFSILLETGLQPCGWLAGYLGSALTSDIDLSFRNLDGNAVQHRAVSPNSGTLTTKVTITRVSSSGGMIIQNYDYEITDQHGPVYTGDTVFGFFSKASLAQQVGVRGATLYQPSVEEERRGRSFDYPTVAPYPATKMRMVDAIELFVDDGGSEGLGFIQGSKKVNIEEWFFKAHFYQDPVCPGSLGLESFLQLLKVVAVERWGGDANTKLECIALGEKHSWNYRGQIIPANDTVMVEAVITAIDEGQKMITADGFLSVDGKTIYQMHGFTLRWHAD